MPKSGNFSPAFLGSLTPATTIQNFLKEAGAKFFVRSDGSTVVKAEGTLKGHEIT